VETPLPKLTEEARHALLALYQRLDERLAASQPVCRRSGLCCDFPTSGHQLWSSALEVAYTLECAGGEVPAAPSGLCPWHVEGSCRQRPGRPLGCRLYFCDPAWADAMPAVYEQFHAELKQLHMTHGIPYLYLRFVDAVQARGGSRP